MAFPIFLQYILLAPVLPPLEPLVVFGQARSRSCQLDEMSLQSFEIAGGEPAQDEFQSQGSL